MYPGQQKFSQFDPVTSTVSGDKIPILRGGQNKIITVDNFTGVPSQDWYNAAGTWTFSSFNSTSRLGVITVPSDATAKYNVGMWIKITQSSIVKFGMITGVTISSISVNFFTTWTFTNETIVSPSYSPVARPLGVPNLPVRSTDANGWGVQDYGTYRRWTRTSTYAISAAAGGWGYSSPGVNLPVMQSTVGSASFIATARCDDAAVTYYILSNPTDTQVIGSYKNQYGGGAVNTTVRYSVVIEGGAL